VSVEELRAWLEIEEHALPSVKNPRKRAIDVSKAELDKKADLTFTNQPTKTGRRITGWIVKAYISGSSGVVTQFVAAIFFYLYNRTVQQGARSDQATANKRRSQGRAILF